MVSEAEAAVEAGGRHLGLALWSNAHAVMLSH